MKTFECTVRENWYGSLETAYLEVTTPKGTTLRIDKWPLARYKNKWDKDPFVSDLVWGIYNAGTPTVQLTREQVLLLAEYSQYQTADIKPRKPKRSR